MAMTIGDFCGDGGNKFHTPQHMKNVRICVGRKNRSNRPVFFAIDSATLILCDSLYLKHFATDTLAEHGVFESHAIKASKN